MEKFDLNIYSKYLCYTCITGGYEYPQDIIEVDYKFDYIIFSDVPIEVRYPWKNIVLSMPGFNNKDFNRFLKICPNKNAIINEYDLAIYIDGNVKIKGKLSKFIEENFIQSTSVQFFEHQYRKSVFDEIVACSWFGHSWFISLMSQYLVFRIRGFKDNIGLYECCVIIWNLKNFSSQFSEKWWYEYTRFSKRDQIPLPYVIFSTNVNYGKLGVNNIRGNSDYFTLNKHKVVDFKIKKLKRFFNFPLWFFYIYKIRRPND
jgi:hypothetical protein